MYESPIDIIYNDIQYKVVEEFDKNVVSAVQSYGIDVNKEELLKALRYDRQQYEKGYADAKSERKRGKWQWLSSTYDRTPCERRFMCSSCHHETITHGSDPWEKYCPNCGARMEE